MVTETRIAKGTLRVSCHLIYFYFIIKCSEETAYYFWFPSFIEEKQVFIIIK
jgi:hypothetical protein